MKYLIKNKGDVHMDDICKKFPKICNCPYKEDIDKDLQNGKTPYYIAKWLKDTECPISHETIRRYQKYLLNNGGLVQEQGSPSEAEEDLLTELQKKAKKAINNLDMDNLSDNVKVQFILGAYKILYGNKHQVNMAAEVTNTNDTIHNFDEDTLSVISDAISRRNNNRA